MTRLPGLRASPDRMFESLYRRHVGEVYRYALVMLGSSADAEDVTQTTFLNAYRALRRGERPRAPGSWLRVIAHNLCLQHFRHAARRPQQVQEAISRQLDGALSGSEKSQLRAHLRQCEPCAHLARSLRAQRRAIRSLGVVPLPGALAWGEFGTGAAMSGVTGAGAGSAASGGALVAGSLAAKLAGATLVGAVIAGAGYEAAINHPWTAVRPTAGSHTAGTWRGVRAL